MKFTIFLVLFCLFIHTYSQRAVDEVKAMDFISLNRQKRITYNNQPNGQNLPTLAEILQQQQQQQPHQQQQQQQYQSIPQQQQQQNQYQQQQQPTRNSPVNNQQYQNIPQNNNDNQYYQQQQQKQKIETTTTASVLNIPVFGLSRFFLKSTDQAIGAVQNTFNQVLNI